MNVAIVMILLSLTGLAIAAIGGAALANRQFSRSSADLARRAREERDRKARKAAVGDIVDFLRASSHGPTDQFGSAEERAGDATVDVLKQSPPAQPQPPSISPEEKLLRAIFGDKTDAPGRKDIA